MPAGLHMLVSSQKSNCCPFWFWGFSRFGCVSFESLPDFAFHLCISCNFWECGKLLRGLSSRPWSLDWLGRKPQGIGNSQKWRCQTSFVCAPAERCTDRRRRGMRKLWNTIKQEEEEEAEARGGSRENRKKWEDERRGAGSEQREDEEEEDEDVEENMGTRRRRNWED